jgi:hypothetical protein
VPLGVGEFVRKGLRQSRSEREEARVLYPEESVSEAEKNDDSVAGVGAE